MRYLLLSAALIIVAGMAYLAINYGDLRNGEIAGGNPATLEQAAKSGDAPTQLKAAGRLMASGSADDKLAGLKILEKLAARNEPQALQRLGMIYLRGLGPVRPDPQRALAYLSRAAKAGSEPARGTLEVIFQYGKYGIPANPAKAEEWRHR